MNGFTGADVIALCKSTAIHAIKRHTQLHANDTTPIVISAADVHSALAQAEASVSFDLLWKYKQWSPSGSN